MNIRIDDDSRYVPCSQRRTDGKGTIVLPWSAIRIDDDSLFRILQSDVVLFEHVSGLVSEIKTPVDVDHLYPIDY